MQNLVYPLVMRCRVLFVYLYLCYSHSSEWDYTTILSTEQPGLDLSKNTAVWINVVQVQIEKKGKKIKSWGDMLSNESFF